MTTGDKEPINQRNILNYGACRNISFESITPGLLVRTTDDGHMLALDFLSTLTHGDRKKASQTLARVALRPDTHDLLTLRRFASKHKPHKLFSFSNAIQLLLVLPNRSVCIKTRRSVAGILADHFEYREEDKPAAGKTQPETTPAPQFSFFNTHDDERRVTLRQANADLSQREMELERQRMTLPLDRLNQCMELMQRCGPLSEDEQRKFRSLITEQMDNATTMG